MLRETCELRLNCPSTQTVEGLQLSACHLNTVIPARLFRHLGSHLEPYSVSKSPLLDIGGHNGQKKLPKFCKGAGWDRRDSFLVMLTPPNETNLSELIGQPKLSLRHLKPVFLLLLTGYCLSFLSFLSEILHRKMMH